MAGRGSALRFHAGRGLCRRVEKAMTARDCVPQSRKVQAPYGAQVQAAIGLTPLAAPVPPTEYAGSKGVMYAADRRLYTHRPKGDTTTL